MHYKAIAECRARHIRQIFGTWTRDMHGDFSALAENIKPAHMVYMLMRYKNRAYIFRRGTNRAKRSTYRAAADTRIYEKLGVAMAHECAVSA